MRESGMTLAPALLERVLSKLGFSARPEPTWESLKAIYGAWCQKVPFDNVRKLIHLRRGDAGALPGDTADDFFAAWLLHGTGGTCWAGNGALQVLLNSLDFAAHRGLATMLVAANVPPNHGTVIVELERRRYVVDAAILHGEPLPLEEDAATRVAHAAWGVICAMDAGQWRIRWRPLHAIDGLECRIEQLQVAASSFHEWHERSRPWSPFNYALYARRNRGTAVLGTAFGQRIEFDATGGVVQRGMPAGQRAPFLVEELGMDEALIAQLPADLATPAPPQSAAARRQRRI
jgi:N-hydroxyarylamine O-acetyltransferase